MAPSNTEPAVKRDFQPLIIEDAWDGTVYLEARVLKTWQGICGANKLLEDREGRYYWWAVLFGPEGGPGLQRVVTFLDWDSMAEALGITDSWGPDIRMAGSEFLH
ncbi:MAG: hypothetical protein FJ135_15815 [Deltaproteobacteria bacterium]|nr:hypothetical protein [Deltaproteobacteria bacterium]